MSTLRCLHCSWHTAYEGHGDYDAALSAWHNHMVSEHPDKLDELRRRDATETTMRTPQGERAVVDRQRDGRG